MFSKYLQTRRSYQGKKRVKRSARFLLLETLETRCLFAPVPSVTTLTLSSDTIRYGENLTFIAEVAPVPGSGAGNSSVNTGSVVFREGTTELGRADVVDGVAKLITNNLDAGLHSRFVAAYSGDGVAFQGSESIDGVITTIAGNGILSFTGDGQLGGTALLDWPSDTVADSKGNLYIADTQNRRIRKVDLGTGVITTVLELEGLSLALGKLAVDANDKLIIASAPSQPSRMIIARFDPITGGFTQLAGGGSSKGDFEHALSVDVGLVRGVAVAQNGDIYFADQSSHRVRKVNAATKQVTTVAGTGTAGYNGDEGTGGAIRLNTPSGLALDDSGNLYICDTANYRIRKVELATGQLTTVAGNGVNAYPIADSLATQSPLGAPVAIAYSRGRLLVAQQSGMISRIELASGRIYPFAGTDRNLPLRENVPATEARFESPNGITADAVGHVYVADLIDELVRRIDYDTGLVRTVAGGGSIGDNGAATAAVVGKPSGLAFSPDGQQLIIGSAKHRVVRQLELGTGTITTLAGNRRMGYEGDGGPAESAEFMDPFSVAFDTNGNLVIADRSASQIRRVSNTTGQIETLVGTSESGYNGDGLLGTQTRLFSPSDIAFDRLGRMFIADTSNHRIRMFDPNTGFVTTVVGTGVRGFAGDNGPAELSQLSSPTSIAFDEQGNLYIADSQNYRIRRVDLQSNVITTVVGNGGRDFDIRSGRLLSSSLPVSELAFDAFGRIYAGASDFLVEIDLSADSIRRLAGRGNVDFNGDDIALNLANIGSLNGFAFDRNNNFYFADSRQNRVKQVKYLSVRVLPVLLSITPTDAQSIYGSASPNLSYVVSGFVNNETMSNSDVTGQPALTSDTTEKSPVGNYTIVATVGTLASRNYKFEFHTGVHAIAPATLLISANDVSKVYGDDLPALTYSFTGFKNGETQSTSDLSGTIEVSTSASQGSPVGTYAIDFLSREVRSNNYIVQYNPGNLTVTPAQLLIIAEDLRKRYCEQMPALSPSYSGFVLGEGPSQLTRLPTVTTQVDADSPVGTYEIQVFGAESDNYNITHRAGQMQVVAQPTNMLLYSSIPLTQESQAIDLTADVFPLDACLPIQLGHVEFYDNGTLLGVANVREGRAVLADVELPAGEHTIVAKYLDPNLQYEASQSSLTAFEPFDVNRDTFVTAMDALLIINWLNHSPQPIEPQDVVLDVNRDQFITPIDALLVINRLNARP